jgi:tetratricopeptide (TPR) repeat protein
VKTLQFVHTRFLVGVIAGLGSLTLAFEAIGAESPGPDFSSLPRDSRTSSSSRDVIIRLPDGQNVRVGGKAGALIAEGYSALQGRATSSSMVPISQWAIGIHRDRPYNKAISSFTAALQANPDRNIAFFIYSLRAGAYLGTGQLEKALVDSSASIQLNPKYAPAYYYRGIVYSRTDKRDKAISDYTAAIELNPGYTDAYLNRGVEYSNERKYKLALRDATMAIGLNPKYADAYHNRGIYYSEIGEFDKAIADFSQAIRFNPRSMTFHGRAVAYKDAEKFEKAITDYDRVIRITPKDTNDYAVRGSADLKKGNYKAALSDFEKAVQLSPNNASALSGLAWFRATCPDASLRNGKEAIRMSMRACELMGWKEPGAISTLAAAYAEAGDFNQAVKYQLQASNMASEYGPVLKEERERLALYREHKPWRSKPLSAR